MQNFMQKVKNAVSGKNTLTSVCLWITIKEKQNYLFLEVLRRYIIMMKVTSTDKAPAAIGPYSQAIEANGFLFASGQVPIDPAVGDVVATGIVDQAEQVMKNIGAILEANNLTYTDVIKTTCFLADMGDFAIFNEVYGKYFTSKPARSCVAVKTLPKNVLCEVEIIAVTAK